jgi:co-chaperonin GroES (HSP10)
MSTLMKMKNKNVLIQEIKEEQVTKSGLFLPQTKHNRKAIVIESGSDEVNIGDIIFKSIGNGTMFNIDGEDYEIIHESDILAILK